MTKSPEKRQTGYVYAVRSYQTEDIYIGSTFGTLRHRLYDHRKKFEAFSNGKQRTFRTSGFIVKYEDAYIELVEKYENINKMELHRHEGEFIRNTPHCVNRTIAGRNKLEYREDNLEKIKKWNQQNYIVNKEKINKTQKEYYETNKDEILERHKLYSIENKEKIAEYHKERYASNKEKYKMCFEKTKEAIKERQSQKYTCECGKVLTCGCKTRHNKTCKKKLIIAELT